MLAAKDAFSFLQGLRQFRRNTSCLRIPLVLPLFRPTHPNYLVFFKARDADALDTVLKEYTAYTLNHKNKPSILKKLEQFKAKVSKAHTKIRNKKKEISR